MAEKIQNSILQKIGFGFTAAGLVFVLSVSSAACLGLNAVTAAVTAVCCLILSVVLKEKVLAPDGFLLVPLVFVSGFCGNGYLPVTLCFGALCYYLMKRSFKSFTVPDCITAGGALGLAFSVTVLFTTLYFGIGATGSTVWEMLKNYRYLGFHPNWRGVFYGTITLFAMITFPFKFRKLNRYLPAEVFSVGIPFLLNLWLNPDGDTTPILEVGSLSNIFSASAADVFPLTELANSFNLSSLAVSLLGGVAVSLIAALHRTDSGKENTACSLCHALSGIGCGFPSRSYSIRGYGAVSAVTAVALITGVFFLCPNAVARIPLHSLAVVFIVSAWQNVPYKKLASSFKEKGVLEIVVVLAEFAAFVFFNPVIALAICVLFTLLVKGVRK